MIMLATYTHSTTVLCDIHIPIYWPMLFVIFQEILNFHDDVGRQGLKIDPCIKFRFPQSFFGKCTCTYMYMYICQSKCIGCDCFLLFSEKYIVYIILTMTVFVGSWSFISLPSFMFVGAAVSEICESNRKKEKEKNGCFQFNTFPRHIIDQFFHQSYLLTISTH